MKYGIIGCGGIGAAHAAAISTIEQVEHLVFFDQLPEPAERLASKMGGQTVASLDALMQRVDAVSVCSPPDQHYSTTKVLLEHGLPVFCEKPLSMSEGEAAELVQLSRQKGVPLCVGFKMRYESVFRRAAEELHRIGRLHSVTSTKAQPLTKLASKRLWVQQVGAMYELSVHEFDLVSMWTGQVPVRVEASVLDVPDGWTREKGYSLLVNYSDGLVGLFTCRYSEKMSFEYQDLTMQFVGEHGYVRIERPNRIVVHTDGVEIIEVEPPGNSFEAELRHFVEGVMGSKSGWLSFDGSEGFIATAMVEAAFRKGRGIGDGRVALMDDFSGRTA